MNELMETLLKTDSFNVKIDRYPSEDVQFLIELSYSFRGMYYAAIYRSTRWSSDFISGVTCDIEKTLYLAKSRT